MTGRLFFVINPRACNGRAVRTWCAVRSYLDGLGVEYGCAFSKDGDDVERLARKAAGPDTIVCSVGGDGTLTRVAEGLLGSEAILGIIPAGTGNDFARTWLIPADPKAACDVILNGKTVAVDICSYNGRPFLNVLGTGLDAEVAATANRRFKFAGIFGYLLALFWQLFIYRPGKFNLLLDGQDVVAEAWLVAIANGRYYGGGMQVAPQANSQDGLVEVVVVGNLSRLQFLRVFPSVYKGLHVHHPAVRIFRSANVELSAPRELYVQADGELVGKTPIVVTVAPKLLRLQVPRE